MVKSFIKGVSKEFKKIIWPTEKEMKTYVVQVLTFVAVLALFFFLVDAIISQGLYLLG